MKAFLSVFFILLFITVAYSSPCICNPYPQGPVLPASEQALSLSASIWNRLTAPFGDATKPFPWNEGPNYIQQIRELQEMNQQMVGIIYTQQRQIEDLKEVVKQLSKKSKTTGREVADGQQYKDSR